MTARLVVYRTKSLRRSQRWAWRLISNGRQIAASGEGYANRAEAHRMGSAVASGQYRP